MLVYISLFLDCLYFHLSFNYFVCLFNVRFTWPLQFCFRNDTWCGKEWFIKSRVVLFPFQGQNWQLLLYRAVYLSLLFFLSLYLTLFLYLSRSTNSRILPGLLILEQRAAPLLGREREMSAGPNDRRRKRRKKKEEKENKKEKQKKRRKRKEKERKT